jgi:signal transduction histidine kinase
LRPIQSTGRDGLALAGTAHDLTLQKNQQAALQVAYEQIAMAHHQLETLNEVLEQKVEDKTRSLSEAYQILEQQNRTLQKLDEIKSDFVSMVSHELRAPLTNISGGIELVLGNPQPLPGSAARSLTLVQTEIRRLTHFVGTILDLSALDAGRIPFYPAPLPLIDLIPILRRQFEPAPGSERIEWNIPDRLPFVLADEHALTSVFFHLIDNALKYAPYGKIAIQVSAVETHRVTIQVLDQGPGIPEEVMPLLFEKFFRVHRGDAQTVYGHGLGLYIVRRLLQVMDSDIRVENRPEGGACFKFWLNVIEENDEHEAAAG